MVFGLLADPQHHGPHRGGRGVLRICMSAHSHGLWDTSGLQEVVVHVAVDNHQP